MINNAIFAVLILILGISYLVLMILPFSIAFFYEKTFKKRAFPHLFIISGVLFLVSFLFFSYDIFSDTSSALIAAGGILLVIASMRLDFVMTGGRR